ncbi:MAG TPA: IS1634 family transposase, partial [Steroidobacteraceae bacterium]
ALLLYDVTSTYLEGRCCELAQHGYSRDHRADRPQIVIGLMCAAEGCPVAVEVFEGNTADPVTLSAQIDKLKQRFHLQRVVMVGDRGLLTSARIEQTLRPAGLDWITALRAPAIKQLAAEGGPLQPSLFDDRDMAEITSPDYPGERLVVCKNPLLAEERARKRAELLAGTENDLARIAARVQRARSPLRGAAAIGQAVGAVLGRRHMAKHFQISIADDAFSFSQNPVSIAAEAALDGIYVVRTNLPAAQSDAAATVRAYKSLSGVEHAFRSLKTVDLELRPVFHWTAPRVRAHVLLCMLAYYLQWHMRQSLAPMLFDEPDPAARAAQRTSPVAKAEPSPAAQRKAMRKRTDPGDGEPLPVHSFHTLLGDLATLTRNVVRLGRDRLTAILATPTRTQHRALDLLGVTPTP